MPPLAGWGGDEAAQPMIVSTGWVADRLTDDDLVLIHVGAANEYEVGHLPGARHLTHWQVAPAGDTGLRLEMPWVAYLDSVFESIGVSDDSRIVIYWGTDWVTAAARVWLALDYLGLASRASIMDGGMPVWVREGRAITRAKPVVVRGRLTPRPREEIIARADWVSGRLDDPSITLLDGRPASYYEGDRNDPGVRPGHIPGAGNVPAEAIVDEETLNFKDPEALEQLFAAAGVDADDKIVAYCRIGQRASLLYFIARYLDYDAVVYDGSFEEWGRRADLPVQSSAGT